jgi:RNA polymerase sigma-70 factor (ECF subfamily)
MRTRNDGREAGMEDIASDVVQACQNGDVQAFASVVAHYERPLFAYIYRLAAGADAEDILQEVFFKAYRQIHTFDPSRGSRFTNWLFRIAHNHCVSQLRKGQASGRTIELDSEEAENIADEQSPTPREAAFRMELSERIAGAVTALPEPFKSAFILRHYEDMAYTDIATIMECSVGTVRSRVARSRQRLAEMLKDLHDPIGSRK